MSLSSSRSFLCVLCASAVLVLPANAQSQRPLTMAGRSTGLRAERRRRDEPAARDDRRGSRCCSTAATRSTPRSRRPRCSSVVEPMMTGIGGDMFALIWIAKEKKLVALNASGRAGSLMTREELVKRGRTRDADAASRRSRCRARSPGGTRCSRSTARSRSRRPLQPAIGYAENGFPVTPVIAGDWAGAGAMLAPRCGRDAPRSCRTATPPKAGEWFRNPDYAAHAARDRRRKGRPRCTAARSARSIVARVQELGGFLTLDDLKKNQPTWVTPISVTFKGYRVWELPPNNQGIAALEMLRILEPYDLKAMGHNSAAYLHHLIEAKKLAYADLARYVGDADHLTIPPSQMLSDAFIAERRSHIDPKHAAQTQVGAGPGAHVERDDLPHRGRQGRQHGVVHQQPVRRVRLGRRRAGHRLRAARSRRRVHDDAKACRTPSRPGSVRSTR